MSQKTQVTFIRHVKFGGGRYKTGATAEVEAKDFDALDAAQVISYRDRPVKETDASDLSKLTRKELEKVKNDELKAYLDAEGIDYTSDAVKADLVDLILSKEGDA